MKTFLSLMVAVVLAASVAGCGAGTETAEAQTMNVACGTCIYGMEGVQGCVAAAEVNGEHVLIEGVEVDAHAQGLCSAPKQASVVGKVEGGKLVASKVTFE